MKKKASFVSLVLLLLFVLCAPASAATVCKIGNKGYSSLQKAIDAVKDGQTIKVTKAIKSKTMVKSYNPTRENPQGPSFTIDFANKKYTYSGYDYAFRITQSKVTFKNINFVLQRGFILDGWPNTESSLTITGGKYSGGVIASINVGSSLLIKGGTFKYKGTMDTPIVNRGTLTVNGGTFDACNVDNYGTCNLKGGKWTLKHRIAHLWNYNGGKMTISGGTYEGGGNTIWNDAGGEVAIKGGTLTTGGKISGAGNYTITGGTISSKGSGPEPPLAVGGTTIIKNCTINYGISCGENGKLTIDGGVCNGYISALNGGEITINKMTVNTSTKNEWYHYPEIVCLIAREGGTIKVNGGSFTATNGYGYCQWDGGSVTFGAANPKNLFHVKELELKR